MTKDIFRLRIEGLKDFENATKIDAVRLAMLIDTDGCISTMKKIDYYVPIIDVRMASGLPVMMIVKWGGCIYEIPRGNVKGIVDKGAYVWKLYKQKKIRNFLEAITSELKLKKKQAELALQMCDILDVKKEGWKDATNLLAEKIHKLNHSPLPNIDFKKLEAISKMNVERKLKAKAKNEVKQ